VQVTEVGYRRSVRLGSPIRRRRHKPSSGTSIPRQNQRKLVPCYCPRARLADLAVGLGPSRNLFESGVAVRKPAPYDRFMAKQAQPRPNGQFDIEWLSPRETEVLEMAAQGLTNSQIAAQMSVTVHSVKFHLASIYRKLDVSNRTEAAVAYLRTSSPAHSSERAG
jgi:DNA-binding CsgD family transcriptional regulator